MTIPLSARIEQHVKSAEYHPQQPRRLARQLDLASEEHYPAFREALKQLMREGRIALGSGGSVVLPSGNVQRDTLLGTYRHNRKGFGFVVPSDPEAHEDLYVPEGENHNAISGDIVRARILSRARRGDKTLLSGRVIEIVERTHKQFVGTLEKRGSRWVVVPDGNVLTDPIDTPDASSRHVRAGTKVVVELTTYPEPLQPAKGVITRILGHTGEKDVDLRSIIIQHNLPEEFPEDVLVQARRVMDSIDWDLERSRREDLSSQTIVTIDPDDAKDYDDAISLVQLDSGHWELGVHIADVATFVPVGSPLDDEARKRGNSTYFPGFVITMLPEVLSNGVCSLQEGVPRLCKSAFIILDDDGHPIRSRFSNTLITSACRLRYREAQAIIDNAKSIPHPDGDRKPSDYTPEVIALLRNMDMVAKRIQKRRLAAGQLVLDLPTVQLVLDEDGRVVDATPEDTSFTHTLIEMFMVEANEAAARLLDKLRVPFLRRIHPGPGDRENTRLREFVNIAGYKLPKVLDRPAMQALLSSVKDRPESYAINLAILKSLTRAEYSPEETGHFALASEDYCHYTSPIRRYADLTIHRLLQGYLEHAQAGHKKIHLADAPAYNDLVDLGRHISFTERRAEDAERELKQVKVLELLKDRTGDTFNGVITGITNFGLFVQLQVWLVEGLIRYEKLLDDWWDVNESGGQVRGQRTGVTLRIGDVVTVAVARVDIARRELDLQITKLPSGKPPKEAQARPEKGPRPGKPAGKARPGRRSSRPANAGYNPSPKKSHRKGRERR